MPRTVVLTSGEHGSVLDFVALYFEARDDPDVFEIHLVEDGHLRHISRRDPTAPGGWMVERLDWLPWPPTD